jgi:hypothetical protein
MLVDQHYSKRLVPIMHAGGDTVAFDYLTTDDTPSVVLIARDVDPEDYDESEFLLDLADNLHSFLAEVLLPRVF